MISAILISLAAFLNACMDKHQHHYWDSIFFGLGGTFWHHDGWKNKYVDREPEKGRKKFLGINIHPAFLDVWHFSKSGMIILLMTAVVLYKPIFQFAICDILLFGTIWNVTFSLFYNVLLKWR